MVTEKTNFELEQYKEYVGSPMYGISYLAVPYYHQNEMIMHARLQAIKYITDALVRNRFVVFSPILYNKEIEDRSGNRPPEGWWLFNQNYLIAAEQFILVELPGWQNDEDVCIKYDLSVKLGKRIINYAWIDDAEKGGGIRGTLHMGLIKAGALERNVDQLLELLEQGA